MWKSLSILTVFFAVLSSPAHAQSTVSTTVGAINGPNGPVYNDASGSVINPIKGPIDNATVGGHPLGNLIPALEQQVRLADSIPQSLLGQPNGVAQLNAQGGLDIPVLNVNTTYTTATGVKINLPIAMFGGTTAYSTFNSLGQESAVLGGFTSSNTNSQSSVSLSILSRPYGPYNAGCSLCLVTTNNTWSSNPVQISPNDFTQGSSAIALDDGAASTLYQYTENYSARLVTQAIQFTATSVTLANSMSVDQMSALHPGMYIATNVVGPSTLSLDATTNRPIENTYWGIIQSWTANTISVYGWAVLGSNTTTANQVPNPTLLDTTKSQYIVPMVFIGVPAKTIANLSVGYLDGSKVYSTSATARSNTYDNTIVNFTAAHFHNTNSLSFHGTTMNYKCTDCAAGAADSNSYGFAVNGSGLPMAYKANVDPTALEFSGNNAWFPGAGAPGAVGTNHILYDFASNLPTSDVLHLNARVTHESSINNTAQDYSVRLVANLNETRQGDKVTGGTDLPALVWNSATFSTPNALCTLSNATSIGFCHHNDNTLSINLPTVLNAPVSGQGVQSIKSLATLSLQNKLNPLMGANTTYFYPSSWSSTGLANDNLMSFYNISPTLANGGYNFYVTTSSSTMATSASSLFIGSNVVSTPYTFNARSLSSSQQNSVTTNLGGSLSSTIAGRTGGVATGEYYASFKALEVPNSYTAAVVQLNGFRGNYQWLFKDDGTIVAPNGNVIADASTLGQKFMLSNGAQGYGEIHFSHDSVASFADPDPNVVRDLKLGQDGLAVLGGIKTDTLTATKAVVVPGVTYANLPTSATVGTVIFCSDCYSSLRDSTNTDLGLLVTWNSKHWVDGVGNWVTH